MTEEVLDGADDIADLFAMHAPQAA